MFIIRTLEVTDNYLFSLTLYIMGYNEIEGGITMSDTDTPQVTVYSTSWCAFCHTEMQWLEKLGVAFQVKDVEADEAAMEELKSKNGGDFSGVPVTDIAGDVILGFNRPALQAALEKHSLVKA